MSASPPKADIRVTHRHVCFGPEADSSGHSITSLAATWKDGGIVRPSALVTALVGAAICSASHDEWWGKAGDQALRRSAFTPVKKGASS